MNFIVTLFLFLVGLILSIVLPIIGVLDLESGLLLGLITAYLYGTLMQISELGEFNSKLIADIINKLNENREQ